MNKLMTKFDYEVTTDVDGYLHIEVTRLSDSAKKKFFQAHGDVESMTRFMNSITDDLAEGYFPKPRKVK
jgi:hypothetical protein